MNLETIRSQVGKYETDVEASAVAVQLQTLIAKHGLEVFKDADLLKKEIQNLELSQTVKAQLSLLFSSSTLPAFILNSKTDLNLVDVDNAVHSVVSSTGLSYKCALILIVDVFHACGLSVAVEYGPQLFGNSVKYKLHAILPSKLVEVETQKAELLIKKYYAISNKSTNEAQSTASEAIGSIEKLCEAGISKGFYLLGRCYLYGECGTEIDYSRALELMKTASERGVAEATAALGDIYYQSEDPLVRDYTLSHHYYTRPGAMAMGKKRQERLQDIYKQHSANKTTIVFSGMILALMIAFLVFFHTGIFSGASRLVIGIILTIISGLAYAMAILYGRLKKYNGIRWLVAVQYFIWALYAFVLLLA